MAVTFVKERKKQKYLIVIAVVVLGGALIFLWLGYFKKEKPVAPPVLVTPYYRKIKIDFEVLKNPLLKELRPFEKIPPFVDEKGRENPFLPY